MTDRIRASRVEGVRRPTTDNHTVNEFIYKFGKNNGFANGGFRNALNGGGATVELECDEYGTGVEITMKADESLQITADGTKIEISGQTYHLYQETYIFRDTVWFITAALIELFTNPSGD